MNEKTQSKNQRLVFLENPHDIETIFESLSIASDMDMEFIYVDMLIHNLRSDGDCDLVDLSYKIIEKLKKIKKIETI